MVYSELTLRHFETPATGGELSGPGVMRGAAGRVVDGTWLQFSVRADWQSGAARVLEARFLAFGCPHVIAAADWICEQMVGRAIAQLPWSVADLRSRFDAPIEKLGRFLIVEDAWLAAMQNNAQTGLIGSL